MIIFRSRRNWTLAACGAVLALAACSQQTPYDDQAHRAEISKIYPAVDWPAYREGVREVCELGDDGLANVFRLAAADGPDRLQSLEISLRYMCPERLKSDI